jgi:hypothetical protein
MVGNWGIKGKKKKVSAIQLATQNKAVLPENMLASTDFSSCLCAASRGTQKEEQPLPREVESPPCAPTTSRNLQSQAPPSSTSQPLPEYHDLRNPPLLVNNTILEEGGAHEESFFDAVEDFEPTGIYFHGRSNNCEGFSSSEGDNSDLDLDGEGVGVKEMLHWPKEFLHEPWEERWKKRLWQHREEGEARGVNTLARFDRDDERGGVHAWVGGRDNHFPRVPLPCGRGL